jgi:hypothetical protein
MKRPKIKRRPAKEVGPSYFAEKIAGLAAAARQLRAEQLLLDFKPKPNERIQ